MNSYPQLSFGTMYQVTGWYCSLNWYLVSGNKVVLRFKLVLVPVVDNSCILKMVQVPVLGKHFKLKLVLVPVLDNFSHSQTGTGTCFETNSHY